MSLITDAWKTAQRERQQRESGAAPAISPVLVPLRTQPKSGFSWGRSLTIGISGLVIVGSLYVMVLRMKKPATLATLPPVPSPLAGTPLLSEPSDTKAPARNPLTPVFATRPAQDTAVRAPQPARPRPRATPTTTATVAPLDAPQVSNADSGVQQTGRLRIAVNQPRQGESTRLFSEALVAHRAGDLQTARTLYERVLVVAPDHADALNNLGVLLSAQGELDRALELLRRAASVAPQSAGTWNNIGAVLREQGKASDATAAFQHALTLDPDQERAKVGLAQQYLTSGALSQARMLLDAVLSKNPTLAEAQYALGQTLELLGDRPGAIRAFTAFIRVAPPRLASHIDRVRQHVDSLTERTP